ARAPEPQEIQKRALAGERVVADEKNQEDHVDREERHHREVLRLGNAPGEPAREREGDRQQENRAEEPDRRGAPPRLREAVERERRARLRAGEADRDPCAPGGEQQGEDETVHSPGSPCPSKRPGAGGGGWAARDPRPPDRIKAAQDTTVS